MTGTDKGGQGLAWGRNQGFVEDYALITVQNRFTEADQAVAIANYSGHMGNLKAARFSLAQGSAELFKGLDEKRFDIVWLQAARFCPIHIFAHTLHATAIHHIVDQGVFFEQILDFCLVEGVFDSFGQASFHLGLFAVAYRLNQ